MVAWSDVCRWNPEPLAQAAESLGRASGALTSIRGEAQSARTRVVSEAPSVTAARGAQGRCEARHSELISRVRGMHRATWDACDGVEMVRKSVLACQDYAAEHPAVVLHDDGSVSASPEAKASGSGGASVGGESGGSGDSAAAEAAKVAGQVAELQAMVSATLAQANQVDQSYAAALTMVMAADKSGDPPNSNQPARTRDTGAVPPLVVLASVVGVPTLVERKARMVTSRIIRGRDFMIRLPASMRRCPASNPGSIAATPKTKGPGSTVERNPLRRITLLTLLRPCLRLRVRRYGRTLRRICSTSSETPETLNPSTLTAC